MINHFMQFVMNHWILWLALIVVIILLSKGESKGSNGVQKISSDDAINLINHEKAKIIDIRGTAEYQKGHLIGSINIPFNELDKNIKKLSKYKSKPIIVVCNSGQTSLRAGSILRKQEFKEIYSLLGGIIGWKRADLPLENK